MFFIIRVDNYKLEEVANFSLQNYPKTCPSLFTVVEGLFTLLLVDVDVRSQYSCILTSQVST